ncbi:MAG: hypothetical protein A2Z25_14335 [Planctomycetes bacterium RBG_16_55_9]|nr:MAG: hypothetical protein A2Z25_14335 [Planctomycetes bacterium RBG_16_55_9]
MVKRRTVLVWVVCLSAAVPAGQSFSQPARPPDATATNIVERFHVNWRSIIYEKTLYNPAIPPEQRDYQRTERLEISCKVELPDPNLVLKTCPDAVIDRIMDNQGKEVDISQWQFRPTPMYWENPQSHSRRMSSMMANLQARRRDKAEYNSLDVDLDAGLLERVQGDIGEVKGHFHALVAESIEYVDVPFEPDDNWLRLTPDVEIKVIEARNTGSTYLFEVEQRPKFPPEMSFVRVGDSLPRRMVIGRQILGPRAAVGSGGEGSSGLIDGKGRGVGRAEKIRYIIAVNPSHRAVPFELKDIPLAAIEGAKDSKPRSPYPTADEVQREQRLAELRFDPKVAKCFKVRWHSITYTRTLDHPAASAKAQDPHASEKLFIRCEAEILDPKLIVATCDVPIIEQVTDSKNLATDIRRPQSHSDRMDYKTLQYRPEISPPTPLIQLEGKARTALGLPLQNRHQPILSSELQPVRMEIQLDPGLVGRGRKEIGCIKGYFAALTAKSFEHVEIPFRPDRRWIPLTSDVAVQISRAEHISSDAHFDIRQRGPARDRMTRLQVGDRLSSGVVVDRYFIGANPIPGNHISYVQSRYLPGLISGSGSTGNQTEKIDYLIATGPSHQKIPFELDHIPLPEP